MEQQIKTIGLGDATTLSCLIAMKLVDWHLMHIGFGTVILFLI